MTDRIKYTPLTPITSDAQVRQAVNNIINNLIPITGQHSTKEHAAVTWLDLLNAGYNLKIGDDGHIIMPSPPEPEKPDMSTPPAVESFSAIASFNYVVFSWQQPAYKNHSHVELWRADGFKGPEDARVPTVLDDAVFRLMAPSIMASDSVLPSDEFRYWARNVSKTGVFGPWTSVDGLLVSVPKSPSYLIDKISGEIRESDLFKDLGDKIDGSDKGVKSLQTLTESSYTVKIDSGNAVSGFGIMTSEDGRSDFIIRSDRFAIAAPQQYDQTGKPVISDAAFPFVVDVSNPLDPKSFIKNAYIDKAFIESLVTGSLVSDVITGQLISGAHIRGGDMAIGNNFNVDSAGSLTALNAFIRGTMQSENFGSGTTGWQINNNGNAEFNNAVVRGTGYFTDGVFDGTVYADKIIGDVCKVVSTATSGANIRIDAYKRERTVLITVPYLRLTAAGMGSVHSSTLTLNIYYGGALIRQLPNFLYSQATGSSAGVPAYGGGFQISVSLPAMQVANAFFTYSVYDTLNGPYNVEVIGPLVMMAFIQ